MRLLQVPAISSAASGPLGLMHLPRLWLKNLLFVLDRLPPDYRNTTGTFDRMALDALGIEADAMLAYFRTAKPDYLQFEGWIRANARHLNETVASDLNARYIVAEMSAGAAAIRRTELGIETTGLRLGIMLNDLDDWNAVHRQLCSGG